MEIINIEARTFNKIRCFKDFPPRVETLYNESRLPKWQANGAICVPFPQSVGHNSRRLMMTGEGVGMENKKKKSDPDEIIKETNDQIEQEKEKNFVNLLAEIIVSITLKEFYETGD
ncbi:hypothetical protein SDC9_32347 [bioreactor metagenome]|uniref:Uncharacterized protein n=1 Tax=bioreactor metagenome TaxID=1076179 RepID=A0A644V584_9ZZZZ|nr:hypothetical protein [Macellibacteroides fermentans]